MKISHVIDKTLAEIAKREISHELINFIPTKNGSNLISGPYLISTVNTQHFRSITGNERLRKLYMGSDVYFVIDGIPIIRMLETRGHGIFQRNTGVDLLTKIVDSQSKILIIGSSEEKTRDMYLKRNIQFDIDTCFVYSAEFNLEQNSQQIQELLKIITEFKPSLICLALGFPKQEQIFRELHCASPNNEYLRCIGVGGSIDILSGEFLRAPNLLQQNGFEWLWRLVQSPTKLFPRYKKDALFLLKIFLLKSIRKEK